MDTNKILLIVGLVLLLFFIMRNVNMNISTPTTTKTTSTTVLYRPPSNVVVVPHYNSYKAQFYN